MDIENLISINKKQNIKKNQDFHLNKYTRRLMVFLEWAQSFALISGQIIPTLMYMYLTLILYEWTTPIE